MNSAWTDFLAREGADLETGSIAFADSPDPVAADAIAVPLVHLGLIRSTGDDSATFLHNLVSNDVKNLPANAAQWNSLNSPKGRMLASLLIWPEPDGHRLALSADIEPAMLKKLSMYVLRSKVKVTEGTAETALIGLAGTQAASVLERAGLTAPTDDMHLTRPSAATCIRLNATSFVLAVPATDAPRMFAQLVESGAARAGTSSWQLAMIRAGVPLITAPTQEEFVAQMLNYELIGGVSFHKGCYPGQEIVARTQYLGKLKKRMYRVQIAGDTPPVAGTDLFTPEFGEQSAGKIVNAAPSPGGGFEALAVMQMSRVRR